MYYGFSELGDKGGMGIGYTVSSVLNHENFLKNPHKTAFDIWSTNGKNLAANGAVMRWYLNLKSLNI